MRECLWGTSNYTSAANIFIIELLRGTRGCVHSMTTEIIYPSSPSFISITFSSPMALRITAERFPRSRASGLSLLTSSAGTRTSCLCSEPIKRVKNPSTTSNYKRVSEQTHSSKCPYNLELASLDIRNVDIMCRGMGVFLFCIKILYHYAWRHGAINIDTNFFPVKI